MFYTIKLNTNALGHATDILIESHPVKKSSTDARNEDGCNARVTGAGQAKSKST